MALFSNFFSRHKRLLFILLLFVAPGLPLFILRVELPRIHIYDRLQAWIVHPLSEALSNASGGVGVLWTRYVALAGVEREVETLRKESSDLKRRILELEEFGRENERLHKLLEMPELPAAKGLAGRIIGQDASTESLSFVINIGSKNGVALRMPVVHAGGVVGTIVKVFPTSAVFVSFLDPSHDIDGLVVRSRARMVVEGKGKGLLGRLKYLDRSDDVRVGDLVVTSGLDGVFPKGWPVGHIVKVDKPDSGVTQEADLRAAVDPGHLEEIVVLRAELRGDAAPLAANNTSSAK